MKVDELTREITFTPGHNDRDRECKHTPKGDHGLHGMTIMFVRSGPAGAVNFTMYTDWIPGRVGMMNREHAAARKSVADLYPMGADLGYHSRTKTEYGVHRPDCTLTGGDCWYDGSALNADPVMVEFVERGEDAVWDALEDYYAHEFEEETA